jgi:PPOX class probable F420-dependent enzyme
MAPTIATAERPDRAGLLAFARANNHAVLITMRRDGRPISSPVTCGVDGEGRLVISTYPERAKTKNARRNDKVAVCLLSDAWDGPYVHIDGTAEVLDLPDALEPLVDYFRALSGEHPDWDEYRRAKSDQGKIQNRITIDDFGTVATCGFPPSLETSR